MRKTKPATPVSGPRDSQSSATPSHDKITDPKYKSKKCRPVMIGIKTADGTNTIALPKKKKRKRSSTTPKLVKTPKFQVPEYTILSPYSHPSSYLKVVVRLRIGNDIVDTDQCLQEMKHGGAVDGGLEGSAPSANPGSLPSACSAVVVKKEPGTDDRVKKHLVAVWPFRDTTGQNFSKLEKRKLCVSFVTRLSVG